MASVFANDEGEKHVRFPRLKKKKINCLLFIFCFKIL